MEEIQYHHRHHHHHGHGTSHENQGLQYATSSSGTVNSAVTEDQQQQQNLSVPIGVLNTQTYQTLGGIQPTASFRSVSSGDSSAEMANYFPDAQTPSILPFRHQQEIEGQAQSTATSNTVVTTNINTINAGPYIPVSAPTTVQQLPQPVRAPFMAQQQQQQQRPVRPPGQPQVPPGIPSYSSQIEGLSVSQAVINDVLVDLQSKVINETLQQYQNESSSGGTYLEPLAPIYIQAPQPTIILQSDLHRLRAELNNRVRPPVVYRYPAGANQFQQHQFQQNTFQAPRFPAPPQQYVPPEHYGEYLNTAYTSSDEYKSTTPGGEHRKEKEERLYNQTESTMLNNDNINDNVHGAFNLQGLSTASFDRYASPYQSSSFLPNLEDQQQGNEETVLTSSHNINDQQVNTTNNMFSTPVRSRPEITFDINNCITRCFEAHRQRVARRRAARQARRARRYKQSGQQQEQQQYQQLYQTDQYQNFPVQTTYSSFGPVEQTPWKQEPPSHLHYSDETTGLTNTSASAHTSQGPYIPAGTYDYNAYSSTDATVPSEIQHLTSEYYQQQQQQQQQQIPTQFTQNQGTYVQPSSTFEYTAGSSQTHLPTYDYQNIEQQSYQYPYNVKNIQQQQQPSFNYATVTSTAYVPAETDIQQTEEKQTFDYSSQALNSSNYYQQQPIHVPVSEVQGTYGQPTGTFEYTRESYQSQEPVYDYQGTDQQSSQYSYNVEDIQQPPQQDAYNYPTTITNTYTPSQINTILTGQGQTFDYTSQGLSSSDNYQQQSVSIPTSQVQEAYTQPSGTFEYTAENTQSQEPIYNYQSVDQIASQYPYNIENIQQQSFDYTSGATTAYIPPETNIQQREQNQTFDYSNQTFDSSNYYQQQPIPTSASQVQGAYGQPTGTFEYTRESYQSQEPIYDYQGTDQQSSQYSYNVEDIQQQQPQQQEAFNYISEAATAYSTSETDTQQPKQNQTFDYSSQTIGSSDQYQQKPVSIPIFQTSDSQLLGQRIPDASIPTGTVEYTRQAYYSQEPLPDTYSTENFIAQHQQQQEVESLNVDDYLKQFESQLVPQQTGGHIQSSNDYQSITTVTTTPFIIQQNVNIQPPQGAAQTYDLQYYTNESIGSKTSQLPFSSSIHEEEQQSLLQQPEQHSEIETSINETTSSLPPPPTMEEIDHQQLSIATNTSEFPPPPTPDHYTYQITQQRPSRSHTSINASTDQPNIYTVHQPLQPTSPLSSDHGTDDDIREEEEIFDLRQCIANCYAKYQDLWNKDEQQKYNERIQDFQQPISGTNIINSQQFGQYQQIIPQQTTLISTTHQEQPRPYLGTGEIHYIDGWTQTPSFDVITQANIVQHKYDETPSSFDTKPYIPHLSTTDLLTDSRGQQTIEYSPPLITQTRHIIPLIPSSVPLSSYEYTQREQQQQQQQQQTIYDHTLPVPPHLSFNDTDYQSNLYFTSQTTAQPRQYQNIPFDTHEQTQQQRYRAHSEPASIQQDSITSIPPLQPSSSQIFEQQPQRSTSIPMIHHQEAQTHIPQIRLLDHGRAYETEAIFRRRIPRIDPKTGLCLVPCPETLKYAHLPPHLRPELFCVELPPPSFLPPVPPPSPPPPPPPIQQQQQQRWCVRCCCVPGQTLIKKVVYKQVEEEQQQQQQQEQSEYDYASVIDQMATRISVRYGNSIMEEGEPFVSGNYNEQLRVVDFPVYVSGQNDPNLTPLVPVN